MDKIERKLAISLEDFFIKGASLVMLPKDIFNKLENEIKKIEFKKVDDFIGFKGLVPDFHFEHVMNTLKEIDSQNISEEEKRNKVSDFYISDVGCIDFVPQKIREAIDELLKSKVCLPIARCFDFKVTTIEINRNDSVDRSKEPFHWDGLREDADFIILMYFNEKGEIIGGGGDLLAGMIKYEETGLTNDICKLQKYSNDEPVKSNETVDIMGVIPALNRNCVFVNNMNPFFVHGVTEYNSKDNERVFIRVCVKRIPSYSVKKPKL